MQAQAVDRPARDEDGIAGPDMQLGAIGVGHIGMPGDNVHELVNRVRPRQPDMRCCSPDAGAIPGQFIDKGAEIAALGWIVFQKLRRRRSRRLQRDIRLDGDGTLAG